MSHCNSSRLPRQAINEPHDSSIFDVGQAFSIIRFVYDR
jgi:hypothetical protein